MNNGKEEGFRRRKGNMIIINRKVQETDNWNNWKQKGNRGIKNWKEIIGNMKKDLEDKR